MADNKILQEKLDTLQAEYSKTKYNKHTNKYLGILRHKMAMLRRALAEKKSKKGRDLQSASRATPLSFLSAFQTRASPPS